MKLLIALCALAVVVAVSARPEATYTDRFDNINLDEILDNKRLLEPYVKCLLDKGRCTPDAKELKEHLREALENNCAKCTEKQRDGTRRVIKHLINKEAEYWTELVAKYDPGHKYVAKYESDLKEIKA
uniref:Putative chemosensory protein 1 n=1 Tax=Conopomorpha sinensis TaxID=940481 RepID=A0A5Q2USW7_9NEOP|nr:putative chemosensory protein 1 [Conopomorpha sinensis]